MLLCKNKNALDLYQAVQIYSTLSALNERIAVLIQSGRRHFTVGNKSTRCFPHAAIQEIQFESVGRPLCLKLVVPTHISRWHSTRTYHWVGHYRIKKTPRKDCVIIIHDRFVHETSFSKAKFPLTDIVNI